MKKCLGCDPLGVVVCVGEGGGQVAEEFGGLFDSAPFIFLVNMADDNDLVYRIPLGHDIGGCKAMG
jgi:hypothetical protein